MLERHYIFPGVIEMNVQARRRLGVNIYLIDGGSEYALIDVGYLEDLRDVLELIRQMDFSLSKCKVILASHADLDHTQGMARAREVLKCPIVAHPASAKPLEEGDEIMTYARIDAQGIREPMPVCKVDQLINEGDKIVIGDRTLEVWHTPGHTAGQLSFRMGDLLFSGDNLFRDASVGVIDAHHGSSIPDYISSLKRIRASDAKYLLPSHGPVFRKDDAVIDSVIARLETYLHMSDFGTCAIDWPLLDQWEEELVRGVVQLDAKVGPSPLIPNPER